MIPWEELAKFRHIIEINPLDGSHSDKVRQYLDVAAVAAALRDIVVPAPAVVFLLPVSFAERIEGSAFEGASAGLWPNMST